VVENSDKPPVMSRYDKDVFFQGDISVASLRTQGIVQASGISSNMFTGGDISFGTSNSVAYDYAFSGTTCEWNKGSFGDCRKVIINSQPFPPIHFLQTLIYHLKMNRYGTVPALGI